MKEKRILNALNNVEDKYIDEAAPAARVHKIRRLPKWVVPAAAAACLCLVIVAGALIKNREKRGSTMSGEGERGGTTTGGSYSVAVYPASESEKNVASADVATLTEEEAMGCDLASSLPAELPEGFHFGRGALYTTLMKNGTRYRMLRIEYITGKIPQEAQTEDGGWVLLDPPGTEGDVFVVCVYDFEPRTERPILSSGKDAVFSEFEEKGGVFVRVGERVAAVFYDIADPAVVFKVVEALR